jgi:hypothetical protein
MPGAVIPEATRFSDSVSMRRASPCPSRTLAAVRSACPRLELDQAGPARAAVTDRSGWWLRNAAGLCVLAAAATVVSFTAQYRMADAAPALGPESRGGVLQVLCPACAVWHRVGDHLLGPETVGYGLGHIRQHPGDTAAAAPPATGATLRFRATT